MVEAQTNKPQMMTAEPPVKHKSLTHSESRIVRAHQFFTEQVRTYLTHEGEDRPLADRAASFILGKPHGVDAERKASS